MSERGEQTSAELLADYRDGRDSAAEELFDRYVRRLTALARARLSAKLRSRIDPEDVVLSAYRSFFIAARNGRFTLDEPGDLWKLLARMTLHKLYRQAVHHTAERRNVDCEQTNGADDDFARLVQGREPSPEEAVAFSDELESLMRRLDPLSQRVLEQRLQGHQLKDIAAEIDRTERTVRRIITGIREEILRMSGAERSEEHAGHPQQKSDDLRARVALSRSTHELVHGLFQQNGELHFQDFLLQKQIGSGFSGKVYRALEKNSGRLFAVKFLRKEMFSRESIVRRFVEEAEIVAQLDHPGVVSVHGFGRTPNGGFFIVQDWIDGQSLAECNLPVDWRTAADWIAQAADAIQHAHERGIVHCDLKPANLLRDSDNRIHVTDFGFARQVHRDNRIAEIAGTVGFMAPEQCDEVAGVIEPWTDVYGLGAVLVTLVTGDPPRKGHVLESLSNDEPATLTTLITDCLQSKPERRPATALVLADRLRDIL